MSTEKRKINVGILPEQKDDYSQFEEEEFRWDRIIPAGVTLLLIIVFALYWLVADPESPSDTAQKPSTNEALAVTNTKTVQAANPVIVKNEEKATELKEVTLKLATSKPGSIESANVQQAEPVEVPANKVEAEQKKQDDHVNAITKPVATVQKTAKHSPVEILDARIKKAQLSSNLEKGMPVDKLSSQVLMSQEGIIKVHLFTEMENLRGQYLLHDWYRNGERQARVKIPVNYDHQRSSSSKFINQQMLGTWTVKVIDEQGKHYIYASFEVIAP